MNNEVNNSNPDIEKDEDVAETVVIPDADPTDNVGDVSVEINVEQLIADIEDEKTDGACGKKDVRRKLEEYAEQQSLEDTYAIEFDPD